MYRHAYPHLGPGSDMACERASYLQLAARRQSALASPARSIRCRWTSLGQLAGSAANVLTPSTSVGRLGSL